MYDWSFRSSAPRASSSRPRWSHDPRVVAGREPCRAGAAREGEQLCEAEAAVAARARIRRLAARVPADERLDDRAPELVPQVERDVRDAERVAGLARGDHRLRRAADPLGARTVGIGPEAKRDADRMRPGAQQRDRGVDAAAHRHRDAPGDGAARKTGPDRVRERVDRQRLAADGGRLEQAQPAQVGCRARRRPRRRSARRRRAAGRAPSSRRAKSHPQSRSPTQDRTPLASSGAAKLAPLQLAPRQPPPWVGELPLTPAASVTRPVSRLPKRDDCGTVRPLTPRSVPHPADVSAP